MSEPMVLYSALYGRYDALPTVPTTLGIPAILYTDDREVADLAKQKGWTEARVVNHGIVTLNGDPYLTGPMLAHKWWKMFAGFDEADATVWMDASMTITHRDFATMCRLAIEPEVDMALMAHPWRNCIYEEADFSASLVRYESLAWDIRQQANFYTSIGHPLDGGLYASGFYIRRNNEQVRKLMNDWWWECITRTHQDQISLPVVLRLNPEVSTDVCLPWHDGPYSWTHLGHHLK